MQMQSTEEEILLNYMDALYRYAMTLSRNPDNAADLVQETYLRATTAKHRLRLDSNVKSWLFTILRNLWLNQLRKARLTPEALDFDVDEWLPQKGSDQFADPHGIYVSKVQVEQVRDAIRRLPSPFREIIILREYEDMSYQEIAEILDCPIGTVMSRLARARLKMRSIFLESQKAPLEPQKVTAPNHQSSSFGIDGIFPSYLLNQAV